MATATNNSPPSPAPPAADAADKPVTNPKSTLYAIGGGVAALLLSLALASPKVFVGFLFGAVCALGGLFVGLVYLLNYAEKSVFEDYNAELKRKEDQPKYEGKVRHKVTRPPVLQHAAHVDLFLLCFVMLIPPLLIFTFIFTISPLCF